MKRKIIKIDLDKCNGCGLCAKGCPEGAIKIIDDKARLVNEMFCDGLGACIGECPQNAITIEERESQPYNETRVIDNILKQGLNTTIAHLKHLKEHTQAQYLKEAMEYIKKHKPEYVEDIIKQMHSGGGACHGSKTLNIEGNSNLKQWPIQLHLISATAPYYRQRDVILFADCVGFAFPRLQEYIKDKAIAIGCPKLDINTDIYVDKITSLIDDSEIKTLTVFTMEVPCCMGLLTIAEQGLKNAKRKVPLQHVVVGINGEIKKGG